MNAWVIDIGEVYPFARLRVNPPETALLCSVLSALTPGDGEGNQRSDELTEVKDVIGHRQRDQCLAHR